MKKFFILVALVLALIMVPTISKAACCSASCCPTCEDVGAVIAAPVVVPAYVAVGVISILLSPFNCCGNGCCWKPCAVKFPCCPG